MATITGTNGNDTLGTSLDGAITMAGGLGNDIYIVNNVGDVVTELAAAGTDAVFSSVSYTLGTNVENLTLTGAGVINGTGNSLNNVLVGNSGNNALNGGVGVDTMRGGLGNDTYTVDNVGDVVTELAAAGADTVLSSISYVLGANVENLTLTGTGAINGTGNSLNNVLAGNAGKNWLSGGGGNDTLTGAAGNDTLVGGSGNDIYQFAANWGNDVIQYEAANNADSISFLTGISPSDILVSLAGNDCVISMGSSHITIQNWTSAKLDKLLFSGGYRESILELLPSNRAFLMALSEFSNASLSSLYAESPVAKEFQNDLNSDGWQTTSLYDANATVANVVNALQQFAEATDAGDNVLLLFDTHGGYNLDPNYNIRPDSQNMEAYNGKLGLNLAPYSYAGETDITGYLQDIMDKAGTTGHVTILEDTCYAGTWVNFFNESKPQNLTVIAASDWDDIGISEAWYTADYTPAHQGFVSYTTDAFSGAADMNADGYLSTGELEGYLQSTMYQYGVSNNWLGRYGNNIDVVWYDASGGNYKLGAVW